MGAHRLGDKGDFTMIPKFAAPWVRVTILVGGLVTATVVAWFLTGHLIPTSTGGALVYQNGLLLLVLGSSIIEHKYTKPADSVVNSLMGLITLLPIKGQTLSLPWNLVFVFVLLVFCFATTCVALSDSPFRSGGVRSKLSAATYEFATFFGQARVLFSVILLFGVFSFYNIQSKQTVVFLCFWGLYLSIWPLRLPELLSSLSFRRSGNAVIAGSMLRLEWPNIVRVKVSPGVIWSHKQPKICRLSDGSCGLVLPLYQEQQPGHVVGTGIFIEDSTLSGGSMRPGLVYEALDELIDGQNAAESLGATAETPHRFCH